MQTPISVSRSIQNPIIKKKLECIVTDHRKGEKSEPIKKMLGLLVERCQGSAEAFRMQVTSDVDLGFIYREDITPAKFQNLANDWRLSRDFRDDMNAFFQSSLREMVDDARTEAKVIVQPVGDCCILELERPEGFATFKMSVELKLVAGEELLRHLMYAVTNLRRRNKKMEEDLADKKKLREEKGCLETDYENLQVKYGQLETEGLKKTKRINSLESKLDDITNDMQLKEVELEELRRTFIDEKELLEEELERMRNELRDAVEDIDMWEHDNIALKEERDQLASRVERQNQDLLKYDHILKKYHSAPISVSENKLQELEESIKEKDQQNAELQNKVTELTRTVKELMTRNTEMQKKTDKIQSDLEKHKRALQAVQNSNLYGPMNLSPQHYGSPILYRPHSPTLLPSQVGMPFPAASRLVPVNSPRHNIPAQIRVPVPAAVSAPIVPASVNNETPTFDKEKRKLQQQRLLQANAKGSSENVPPPAP